MSDPVFVIDCGDKRNVYIYAMLKKRGFGVIKTASGNVFDADKKYVFLYAPAVRLTADMTKGIPIGSTVFCTDCCSGEVREKLKKERNVTVFNYFDDEYLAVRNAALTAEGALAAVITETDKSLNGLNILVLGGGRVGKCAARILQVNGCKVSIATRRSDEYVLTPLFADAVYHFEEIDRILHGFDVVINTVPAMILKRERLLMLKKDCFVLDLASKPGGVDTDAAGELGTNLMIYLGVPGKVAPKSAAELLLDSVLDRMV